MLESKNYRAITAHRDSNDRPPVTTVCRGESFLDIGNEIFHDVIFVAVLGAPGCVHVIRRFAFGHHENHAMLSVMRDIRIVCPITIAASSPMKYVHGRQSLGMFGVAEWEHNAVWHLPVQSRAEEGHIDEGHVRRKSRVIRRWCFSLLSASGEKAEYEPRDGRDRVRGNFHHVLA